MNLLVHDLVEQVWSVRATFKMLRIHSKMQLLHNISVYASRRRCGERHPWNARVLLAQLTQS